MKTIKVIDLYNKIAHKEEIPKELQWCSICNQYEYTDGFGNKVGINLQDTSKEDKKIEYLDLEELNDLLKVDLSYDYMFHKTHKMLIETKGKINEIIDRLNGE